MGFDLNQANETLLAFERLVNEGRVESWSGELKVGVDLGTANIVVAVVDSENRPIAGISTPVRESGDLKDTPGIEIIGPAGSVKKDHGVIVALRHIHMSTEDAKKFGVKDKDVVDVIVGNETRKAILTNVLVRVSDKFVLEMHLDIDEGNAVGAGNNDPAYIRKY